MFNFCYLTENNEKVMMVISGYKEENSLQ